MLCVHVYRTSQFMAVGFYRDQMCCSHTEPACVPCCISYFSWKHIQSQFCSWNVLHLLWTLLEWRVVVSPYLSWCFRRAIRYKSFCGGGGLGTLACCGWRLFKKKTEIAISIKSQWGTGGWHGLLEEISLEWCPCWLSPSLHSCKAVAMEKISSAALR